MIDNKKFTDRLNEFLANFDTPSYFHEVKPDTDLFDAGVLDSTRIVELILFIEALIDAEIPVDDYKPESFRTIAGIYQIMEESFNQAHCPQSGTS